MKLQKYEEHIVLALFVKVLEQAQKDAPNPTCIWEKLPFWFHCYWIDTKFPRVLLAGTWDNIQFYAQQSGFNFLGTLAIYIECAEKYYGTTIIEGGNENG